MYRLVFFQMANISHAKTMPKGSRFAKQEG